MSRFRAVGLLFLAVLFGGVHSASADPEESSEPPLRPTLVAILRDGRRVEGLFERFNDGIYWVQVNGKRERFDERDLQDLEFRVPLRESSGDPAIDQLIRRFFTPTRDAENSRRGVDPTLITELAAVGPKAVKPLLAAFKQHDDDYQAVGAVLKQMGPTVFPLLVEEVRNDPGRSARFPVWWALRESGVEHAEFVQELLKDKDPRIRLLAMEVLYSWSITSGTVLPKSLDIALIQVFDDPDQDVRHQAPLILGRIGFRSELVLPALLRAMEDDKYASLRSNAVIAIGYLGRELKPDHKELARIITSLSQGLRNDGNDTVRAYCALSLGELGPKAVSALPALRRATDDRAEIVRKYAEDAIDKIE